MSAPVLVTGATGTVGSEVVRELLDRKQRVRATATNAKSASRTPTGAQAVRFDFEDPSTFDHALHDVDRVFLVRPPHMSSAEAFEPFIGAMERAGVRQVVFLSLLGAQSNPIVPHHAVEKALMRSTIGWTMLRPSFFMQNLTTTHLPDIRDRGKIIVPAGRGRTSFIDARDIAAAAAVVLTEPGHLDTGYALTGSEALGYAECASTLSEVTGRPIVYTRPSGREFARHMKSRDFPTEFITVMRGIYLVVKLGRAASVTNELQTLIGREPISFRRFARDNAELFRPA
ncbi:MAG: SDR family oxidoreductase [Actinomycetota bacterium]|jgi:uncharacterized protein YbjT (DUF2867 family)|nr:SDR family oxidoreductase [Actinomycetota bacterium]